VFVTKRRLVPTRVCVGCGHQVCKAWTERLNFLTGRDIRETVALRFCLNCVEEARSASTFYSTGAETGSALHCIPAGTIRARHCAVAQNSDEQ
jgi:hypothetical protein